MRWLRSGLLPSALLLSSGAFHAQQAAASTATPDDSVPDRRIAVTIDDLPWQGIDKVAADDLAARHARLVAQLKQAGAPVVGFVNESKLELDGAVRPQRLAMLRDWLDAGFELGNHTWGHVDLHAVGVDAFQQDILRGERQLRPLLAERGQAPRWFRHPYLRAGRTRADKAAVADFLADHGYRVAPVTVDNGEWVWAFAYERTLQQADPATREATLERLRRGYVPYMLNKLDYYERQSIVLLGYALPQVWLLHANTLNADTYAGLIGALRRRGYRTIGLDEAVADPAYARPDGYEGRWGPSWLHRWAMAERKPKAFYAGEPQVPRWVLDLAGLESE
ncbi:polysaccharide deacetylase family protein [Marilutibacter chinensis]|uniref:polysaccharide deacetylase family protein n=1 Tax=Marilutibacter chinensis TaxID=2912247 RepID=UPI003CCE27CB